VIEKGMLASLLWFVVSCTAMASSLRESYVVAVEADDVVSRVLFQAIEEEFLVNITYRDYSSFDAILDAVATGESDFAANVTYTDARAQRFAYSNPTNIEYTYLYSYSGEKLAQMQTVAVPQDTIYASLINSHFPSVRLISYQGHEEAMELLSSGKVQGVVDAINQLKPMLLAGLDAHLLNDQLSIKPVSIIRPKGKHKQALDKFVTFLHSEQIQRKLRESIAHYQFEIRRQALRKAVLQSDLQLHRPLRIKLDDTFPYAQYGLDGSVEGISADILVLACQIMGIECEVVSKRGEIWENMFQDLIDKKIDVLTPMMISEKRKLFTYFSAPYHYPESMVIKRVGYKDNVYSNVSELISERVGVVRDVIFDELLTQLLPQKPLYYYDDQDALVEALINKEIDYAAMGSSTLNSILRNAELLPVTADKNIGSFYRSDVAIGFVKNSLGRKLAPLFTRALKMIDTQAIINRYDKQPDWRMSLEAEQEFAHRAQALFIVLLAFMVVVALFLHSQSHTDNLTNLRNRRALYLKHRRGLKPNQALVYLDVNDFKNTNDTYGHEVGDLVLKKLASLILKHWPGNGYRIGGDEFILIGESDTASLQKAISQLEQFSLTHGKTSHTVTVAIGISARRKQLESLSSVLKQTDKAMYRAKQKRREHKQVGITYS